MKINYIRLSKKISYILRHHPEAIGITLDAYGFADENELLKGLNQKYSFGRSITHEDIVYLIENSEKQRFAIQDDKIRALYGHSLPSKVIKAVKQPPVLLYHGTSPEVLQAIREKGLLPMNRQYVHLSEDRKTAEQVGRRHCQHPVILVIEAQKAYQNGISFFYGNDTTWLSQPIPPAYIHQ